MLLGTKRPAVKGLHSRRGRFCGTPAGFKRLRGYGIGNRIPLEARPQAKDPTSVEAERSEDCEAPLLSAPSASYRT